MGSLSTWGTVKGRAGQTSFVGLVVDLPMQEKLSVPNCLLEQGHL